ncbi:hypothetical protein MYAM1_002970 [Malassezia yamatoensis]|uniref:DH domain-containing protein n=1 Tax=Malassezia yamatoensis TaxID=253288 RepID=A0AAJ5YWX3_9BASI|nr:hypothetical protein MYAM1_002970 [Malassezia yamatoensis]
MRARDYAPGSSTQREDPSGSEWNRSATSIPRTLRRVASGDIATLSTRRNDSPMTSYSPRMPPYSPLDLYDMPSGSVSPSTTTQPEDRPLSRTASRILRLSRSFSRLGDRKSSTGSNSAIPTPTLGGGTSRSNTPTSVPTISTVQPSSRSDSTHPDTNSSLPNSGSSARWRTRTALVHARDSPEIPSAVIANEFGQISSFTPSPQSPDLDAWPKLRVRRGTRKSDARPTLNVRHLKSATTHSPRDDVSSRGQSPVSRAVSPSSRLMTSTSLPKETASQAHGNYTTNHSSVPPHSAPVTSSSVADDATYADGLGLTIDGMRLAPDVETRDVPAGQPARTASSEHDRGVSQSTEAPTSPRLRTMRSSLTSTWMPTKRREKPLPPVSTESNISHTMEDRSKRSNNNLRRLFRTGGSGQEDDEKRPNTFRRRRSDARLLSTSSTNTVHQLTPPNRTAALPLNNETNASLGVPGKSPYQIATNSPPLLAPTATLQSGFPISSSTSSSSSSALPAESVGRTDTPATSRSDSLSDLERKRSIQRENILNELAETERTYAADLAVVQELYLTRARLYAGIKTSSTSRLIASSHSQLQALSTTSDTNHTPSGLGTSFTAHSLPRSSSGRSTDSMEAKHLEAALHHPLSPKKRATGSQSSVPSMTSTEQHREGPSWAHPERSARSPQVESQSMPSPNMPRTAPLSVTDITVIFAGLEPCATLASEMSCLLQKAVSEHDLKMVAKVFLRKMSEIEQVYTLYCGRHEAAMTRLHEVAAKSAAAAEFLAECDAISREHSRAWDLPSLLIKPVQRVLKYPLFLKSIVDCTPAHHLALPVLEQALHQIQHVADRINENKKQIEIVERHGFAPLQPARQSAFRRPPTALRIGRNSPRLSEQPLTQDENQYKASVERLDESERELKLFGEQCEAWTRGVRALYTTQLCVIDHWIAVYRTGETPSIQSAIDRLAQYRVLCQHTVLDTMCTRLETEVKTSISATIQAVQHLLERPRMVIANRAAKEHEYRKYLLDLARRPNLQPTGGARAFHSMHMQLIKELPSLIYGMSLILGRCVGFFAEIQANYFALVAEELHIFCVQHFPSVLSPKSATTPIAGFNPLLTPTDTNTDPLLDALASTLAPSHTDSMRAPHPNYPGQERSKFNDQHLEPAETSSEETSSTSNHTPAHTGLGLGAPPMRPTRSESRTPRLPTTFTTSSINASIPPPLPSPISPTTPVPPSGSRWPSSRHSVKDSSTNWDSVPASFYGARSHHSEDDRCSVDEYHNRDSSIPSSAGHSVYRDARASISSMAGYFTYHDANTTYFDEVGDA